MKLFCGSRFTLWWLYNKFMLHSSLFFILVLHPILFIIEFLCHIFTTDFLRHYWLPFYCNHTYFHFYWHSFLSVISNCIIFISYCSTASVGTFRKEDTWFRYPKRCLWIFSCIEYFFRMFSPCWYWDIGIFD